MSLEWLASIMGSGNGGAFGAVPGSGFDAMNAEAARTAAARRLAGTVRRPVQTVDDLWNAQAPLDQIEPVASLLSNMGGLPSNGQWDSSGGFAASRPMEALAAPDFNHAFGNTAAPPVPLPLSRPTDIAAAALEQVQRGIPPPSLPSKSLGEAMEPGAKEAATTPEKNKFAEMMKGLKAPVAPAPHLPGQPAAALRPTAPIKAGELFALLQQMGASGDRPLPSLKSRI